MRLSADGEACLRHIWGKGEEQERSRQTRAQRRAACSRVRGKLRNKFGALSKV